MKTCTKCGETKPKSEFHIHSKAKDNLRPDCKSCVSLRSKEYIKNNKDKIRNNKLKYHFSITLSDYNDMYQKQNGCCYICGASSKEFKKSLAVDHCHTTQKIRKLLCGNCNTLLGKAKDNIEILKKAISYLEEHNE